MKKPLDLKMDWEKEVKIKYPVKVLPMLEFALAKAAAQSQHPAEAETFKAMMINARHQAVKKYPKYGKWLAKRQKELDDAKDRDVPPPEEKRIIAP